MHRLLLLFTFIFVGVSSLYAQKKYPLLEVGINEASKLSQEKQKNVLFSPLSLYTLNSMLANMSVGETKKELIGHLGYTKDEIVLLNSYLIDLQKRLGEECVLKSALRYSKGYALNSSLKKILEENYEAEIASGDFIRKGEKVKDEINNWFYENTDYKIKDMIESISPMDKLILMNALYFKAEWEHPFDTKQTYNKDFHLNNQKTVKADFLSKTETVKCYASGSTKAIILPYKGNYEMLMISTPTFSFDAITAMDMKLKEKKVHIEFPKFVMNSSLDCIELMRNMNVTIPFQSGADFTMLFKKSEKDLFVSKMYQKSFLKIDEIGTVAVAASVAKVSRSLDMKDYEEYIFDQPFYFIIRNKMTKEPLFIGKVNNPVLN
ncbi:serpin family protein [Flammeovirga aprica]|uniref:Serpin family protein n=1 Tax=Flammeovirga aprica JL-4 TaxID=694437 RepID=A0A7X9RUP1_9BACT|nr:serpin family protein [Flammeovirga aprica]NME69063.1 serpin family protein [Flammeovirga aprica JL-4]